VEAVDEAGDIVTEVTITPKVINITLPINLLRGFKTVAVKVVTTGSVANGYRLTNIQPTPPTVTISSQDPELLNEVPGFIETQPLDLTGLTDDVELRLELNLPAGITLVGEQSVLVQVGIATMQGSLRMALPIEKVGLPPNLAAVASPPNVDAIISGPIPILDNLTPASFRVQVDLTNLEIGTYQLQLTIDLIPDDVIIDSINPETVEVIIIPAPTPTPTSAVTATPRAALMVVTPAPKIASSR
jgi:YbbR domain-containing protein